MSNTYMDYLDTQIESESVIFHSFLLEYRKKDNTPICFVEGFDDSYYYRSRIEPRTNNMRAKFITCNGKQGVLDIFNEINERHEFKHCKLFFFVDRDFDKNISSDKIYITPSYSIENLYTSLESFKLILGDIFRRGETDTDYQNSITLFRKRQDEFHDIVQQLNALLACDRELSMDKRSKASINGVTITEYVSIDIFNIKHNEKFTELIEIFNHISQESLQKKMQEFQSLDKQKYFRGKFELQFFCSFIDKLAKDSNIRNHEKRQFFASRIKTDITLSKNPLLTLSTYAHTPECLIDYIDKVWKQDTSEKVS
jgi:Protein of unknown function (DUF4435)